MVHDGTYVIYYGWLSVETINSGLDKKNERKRRRLARDNAIEPKNPKKYFLSAWK